MGLAISVVFSSVIGYLLGVSEEFPFQWSVLIMLAIGGYCMVGASNVFNQIIEKDLDAKMDRTKNRPIPSGKMSKTTAFVLGTILTIIGIAILYVINPKSAMFGAISIFLYVSVYTPLKTLTPLSVFVGAFPGAIPFMLGTLAIKFIFTKNNLQLITECPDGDAKDDFEIDFDYDEKIKVAFNYRYILEGLKAMSSDVFTFNFNTSTSAILFLSDYNYLVMPMNIGDNNE